MTTRAYDTKHTAQRARHSKARLPTLGIESSIEVADDDNELSLFTAGDARRISATRDS